MTRAWLVLAALASCRAPAAAVRATGVVVLISATAEWTAVRARFPAAAIEHAPHGEWFVATFPRGRATFVHGGWGKVAAASSTQYAIDTFHPALLVNLGTAGGFDGLARAGDVVLVTRATIYDIVERMGDPAEAIADYATTLATTAWPRGCAIAYTPRRSSPRIRISIPRRSRSSRRVITRSPATGSPARSRGSRREITRRS